MVDVLDHCCCRGEIAVARVSQLPLPETKGPLKPEVVVELTEDGGLYASVSLPNLIVGTVGGGTSLPSQRTCLEILGLAGPEHAEAFAEVCAGLSLAGELSIIAALSSNEFARAHSRLARGKRAPNSSSGGS